MCDTRKPLSKNIGGTHGGRLRTLYLLPLHLGNDQDLFQAVKIGGRLYAYVPEQVAALRDLYHRPDGQSFGEDPVTSTGDQLFIALNLLVGHHVVEHKAAGSGSFSDSIETGF